VVGWGVQGSRVERILKWPFHWWRNRRKVESLVTAAVAFGSQKHVELVWAVLDSPTSIAVSRKVAKRLGVPHIAMVWDDIQHNLQYFGVYRFSQRFLLREWDLTLREARNCAVIGEAMKSEYDRTYGTNAVIVRHGVSEELVKPTAIAPSRERPIRIGFIGSVTAGTAFQCFVRALDSNGWQLNGKEVRLLLAGHRFDLRCQKPANIEYRGWRSLDESIAMLGECDLNYLPQPFELGQQHLARLSFPTKVTSYLAAGRPVLLHCPEYASLCQFLRKHSFGVWVGSLDEGALVAAMESLLSDRVKYSDCVNAGRIALHQEFSDARFRSSFTEFLNVHDPEHAAVELQEEHAPPIQAGNH